MTTSLDPHFNIAYRFGSIFLSEPYPGGGGRPDLAIALLRKGIGVQPTKWQYYHDIAFVYYWQVRDMEAAADWFRRAASQPNAPNWLEPVAATMLIEGGDRASARFLLNEILKSEEAWIRRMAARALKQVDALDGIEILQRIVNANPPAPGQPYSWEDLVRRGRLRGIPVDTGNTPFAIDPATGAVSVSPESELFPDAHTTGQVVTADTIWLVVFAWLGLSVGSFLNVCIHRIPSGASVANPPSRCPGCGYQLRWFDNIPVVSYIMLGGRCRQCRAPISLRYPIVELLTMAVFLLHWWMFGWTPLMAVRLAFACAMIVLFAIDLEHHLLPNVITLPGIVAGSDRQHHPAARAEGRADRHVDRRGSVVGDRRGLLPLLGPRRHGRRRRQDARDDRGVSGLETGAGDAGAVVSGRIGHRHDRDRDAPRRHEIRAALRHVPGPRRARGLARRRSDRRLVCRDVWLLRYRVVIGDRDR